MEEFKFVLVNISILCDPDCVNLVILPTDQTHGTLDLKGAFHTEGDAALKRTYDLILSVVGVGIITAIDTIVYTNNFQNFDTPRQYASFIGVAPFDHTSGTSVYGRTRVSQFCRKQQKVSITMAARSAIIHDPWMKNYYHRKMKEKGDLRSQHGVVLNAVKFKLILRMFAVVKSGIPYKVMKY